MKNFQFSSNGAGEQALKDNLNFLQKVADLSPNLLYVIELGPGKIIYVNHGVRDLLALEPEIIIEKGTKIFKNIVHPSDYDLRLKNLEDCTSLTDEEVSEVEVRILTRNEEWQWFKIKDKVFNRDINGRVTHIVGSAYNIHEQKVWEEKQREEHRRLENAQKIGHIGSFERLLPGDVMHCSEEFYNILGIPPRPEGLTVEEFYSFVHPEDQEALKTAVKQTHATGKTHDTITRIIRPDNTIRHIHRRAGIINDEHGKPLRVYGTIQDITERVNAEEERERLNKLMRSTEVVSGTGSYEADIRTNRIFFSDGLYRIFGYHPGDFEPSQDWINDHSHPDDISIVRQILEEAANSKKGYSYTRRIYRKDGELRYIESQGSLILDEQGKPEKFIGLVQDITERKKAEKELHRSEERSRNLLKVLQNAPDSYLVLTPELNIELVSDSYLKATGSSREEITGRNIFDVFPDNPALEEATGVRNLKKSLQTVLDTKKPHRMPIQHYDVRDRNGGFIEKYWSPTNTPVLNQEGKVEYIIHRVLDITEIMKEQAQIKGLASETEMLKTSLEEIRLQAEQLKENKILLQSIFDASPNSIILYKPLYNREGDVEDFEFFMVNAFNQFSLGISKDIQGSKLLTEFPGVKDGAVYDNFKKTVETGIPANFEVWYEGEGISSWFHFRAVKVNELLLVTAEDITERKQAEETLQQMLNGSISAITILQSVRNDRREIVDFLFKGANKAAEHITGIPNEEFIGRHLLDLFPGVEEAFFEDYVRVVETGEPLRFQQPYAHEHFDHWFDISAVRNGDGFIMTFLDITEQKKAEQQLIELKEELTQKATDKYRKIINSMDEGFCLIEIIRDDAGAPVDYRFLEANPIFEVQTGLQNVLGKTIDELVPNFESSWKEAYGNVALTGKSIRFEDYSEPLGRWFDVNAFRIDAPNEQHVAIIFKDITARKEAEERKTFLIDLNNAIRPLEDPAKIQETAMSILGAHLEVNRAYYSEILEDGDTLSGRQGYIKDIEPLTGNVKISDFSPTLHRQFHEGETLVLEDFLQVYKNDEKARNKIAASQVRAIIAVPLIKNDQLVALVAVQQKDPRQWTPQEVALVEQVSEQTWAAMEKAQAEKALRESEQRFRNLVESSAIAVWESNPQGEVITDSPSWRKFTGQSFSEWIGNGWLNAVYKEDKANVLQQWQEAVANHRKIDMEFRLIKANGEPRWTNVKAIPILDLEGKVSKWSGMNLDIHDRKMTEEALIRAKEDAEAASKAKEDFVSTMSHEIRTPLNAVIGLTNLLLENNPREDQKENLTSLSFSADNLLSLINDILDFSKLEAGKGEVEDNIFNLPNLILSLQQLYAPQAKNNKSRLYLELDDQIPELIVTDQLKLSQVLHNLMSNAVKFTRRGSIYFKVSVNRRKKSKLWLDFVIEDTGIGVPEEKLAYIFEKFSQAESATVRQYGGTGLGLTITRLLLELLGSEIKVESQIGKGSKFYFTLPVKIAKIKQAEPEGVAGPPEESIDLANIDLLVVEDVEINRNILLQFFQKWWQLKPDEAVNGKEAVEMAKQKKYDLILMDIRMPVMDGYEATKHIRKIKDYYDTPILALTADKRQEEQQTQEGSQFNDFITKPFDPAQLRRSILYHLKVSSAEEDRRTADKASPPHPVSEVSENVSNQISREAVIDISRYTSLAGENPEILEKLVGTSLKSMQRYREEFIAAAEEQDQKALSDLVHKNTVTLHYIQAKSLGDSINEYRNTLKASEGNRADLGEKSSNVLQEFDKVISALGDLVNN